MIVLTGGKYINATAIIVERGIATANACPAIVVILAVIVPRKLDLGLLNFTGLLWSDAGRLPGSRGFITNRWHTLIHSPM
jgi:hypothetical protein